MGITTLLLFNPGKVTDRFSEDVWVVHEMTKTVVTRFAEQSAKDTGFMAMVDSNRRITDRSAYLTRVRILVDQKIRNLFNEFLRKTFLSASSSHALSVNLVGVVFLPFLLDLSSVFYGESVFFSPFSFASFTDRSRTIRSTCPDTELREGQGALALRTRLIRLVSLQEAFTARLSASVTSFTTLTGILFSHVCYLHPQYNIQEQILFRSRGVGPICHSRYGDSSKVVQPCRGNHG